MNRKLFVASAAALLAGCDSWKNSLNENAGVKDVLHVATRLNHSVIGTHGMAKLYAEADIDHDYPTNGDPTPTDATYQGLVRDGFRSYRMPVSGLVDHPQTFDLRQLRALATLSQITRHDCVEGWSVVGKWGGVPLAHLLALVKPATCGSVRGLLLVRSRRQRSAILRQHRRPSSGPPADPVGARSQRKTGRPRSRRSRPATHPDSARVQEHEVGCSGSNWSPTSRSSSAATAAIGKTRATNGTRAFDPLLTFLS